MSSVDRVKSKVQRMLTEMFGSVRIDNDGDFIIKNESAVVFVRVSKGFGDDGTIVNVWCPMVVDVKLTPEVYKWVAIDGSWQILGTCRVAPDANEHGRIEFAYSLIGDDIDESELEAAVHVTALVSNRLDDELKAKFGGKLFTE